MSSRRRTSSSDSGADILRLWVCASDYADDLRIGPEILKTFVETYRKLRNTIRWMLGTLAHFEPARGRLAACAGARALMLHRLAEIDEPCARPMRLSITKSSSRC